MNADLIKSVESINVPLPYNLHEYELELDPAAKGYSLEQAMSELNEEDPAWIDPEEHLAHIFLGALVLFFRDKGNLAECLKTSMVWYSG